MANAFWAVPSRPPGPPPNPWPAVSMTWVGTNGTEWDLCSDTSGVRLAPGVRGLTMPPRDRYTSQYAGVAGSRSRGGRTAEREVFWPLAVWEESGTQAWLEYDAAWWASLNPRGTGVWRVTRPNGQGRVLTCRPTGAGGKAWDAAPGMQGWTKYGVYLMAEDPFWYGPEIKSPLWTSAEPIDFIDSVTLGPPYHPGSATTIDSASLTNPGDEVAWPTWTVTGPVDSVQVSSEGHSIGYGSLIEGDVLVIDTDPRVQRATLNGADVTGDLSSYDFAPIPPGETVKLDITMVGGGTLRASFRPRFDRAW